MLAEGAHNVSIRKVAERAGYAYTTVYQYYQGLDELLQATKRVMVGEFLADLKGGRTEREALPADIRRFCRAHAAYFVERPNVYEFLYAYRLGDDSAESLAQQDFKRLWLEIYRCITRCDSSAKGNRDTCQSAYLHGTGAVVALLFQQWYVG